MAKEEFEITKTPDKIVFELKNPRDFDALNHGIRTENNRYFKSTPTLQKMSDEYGRNRTTAFFVKFGNNQVQMNQRL